MTAPDPELEHHDVMPAPVTLTCRAGCSDPDRYHELDESGTCLWVAGCGCGTVRSYVSRAHADEMYRAALGEVWLSEKEGAAVASILSGVQDFRHDVIRSLLRRLGVRV